MEKSKRNILNYPLIIGFLLLLILPVANNTLGIWKFDRVSENRIFTDSLEFDINHLDLFPEDAEDYVNDNFSFRTPLLDVFHKMKYYAFGTSPHPDKLIIGNAGWFFMAGKELADYQGKNNFDRDTLQLFLEEWKRRKDYIDEKNIKTYWMIAPTAHHVYSEYLPFNLKAAQSSRVEQLKAYFKDELPELIVDPLASLREHKKDGKLYYQQDNHWTFRAGKVTNEYFIQRLRQDFPNHSIPLPQKIHWNDTLEFNGIHHKVLGIETIGEIRQLPSFKSMQSNEVSKYKFPVVPGFAYSWDYERRFKNDGIKDGLRIVIIRDSFGEQIMPFMSESFSESVFIFDAWQYKLNEHIIDSVMPDVVLFLMVETHLESIVNVH